MSKSVIYAMYKGDTYIDQGTADELSRKHHFKKHRVYELASKRLHKRSKGNATLMYRMEEE